MLHESHDVGIPLDVDCSQHSGRPSVPDPPSRAVIIELDDGGLSGQRAGFPLIGGLVGLIGALFYLLFFTLGFPPGVAAILSLSAMVLVTGGLHEDGLADVADGFGGGRTRDDKLRIMRDSRLGSFGAIALVLSLLLRASSIAALTTPSQVAVALIASAALSRAALPVAMATMAQARREGLAASAGRPHSARAAAGLLVAVLIALIGMPVSTAIVAMIAAFITSAGLLTLAHRQIGGITGDVLGALQQIVECACLLAAVAMIGMPVV